MPTRFDHAVIAVRDLDSAIQHFQHLGFDARPGGRHTGRGTHNGLVRFGLDYFELLSVYDEDEARASNPRGLTILDSLNGRDAALVGYALATQPGYENVPVYPHNLSYTVHIDSPASKEDIAALHEAVERACPILNLLINPQQIHGTILQKTPSEAPIAS